MMILMNKNKFILSEVLGPFGLEISQLEKILELTSHKNIDFSDLYLESTENESWFLEDNHVKEGVHQIQRGIGVRAISETQTGFAFSNDMTIETIKQCARHARAIVSAGTTEQINLAKNLATNNLYSDDSPATSLEDREKLGLIKNLNTRIRESDPRVKDVKINLSGQHSNIVIAHSIDGIFKDSRPLVRLNVTVVIESDGRTETASYGGGARSTYALFLQDNFAETIADEALRQASIALESRNTPAGEMTVVLGAGWPGILLHEAIGHGLEADFNRKGTSVFSNLIGEKIANEGCTVVDDGTLMQRRGSLNMDDEGIPSECTTLIDQGRLSGFMQDRQNALLMRQKVTGNGRRQSYAHRPMPRMTNTYMLPGNRPPEEIIRSVKKGLYAVSFGGGQVDITNGKFVFSASEAYLIENGKITAPVRGATLIGDGATVLKNVSMVGNDLKLDSGIGTCGKSGQSVPVGVGQPTLKIDQLTVGGTQA
jgi:TldD protein